MEIQMYFEATGKFRRESFGGLVYNNRGKFISLNQSAADVYAAISLAPLTTKEIAQVVAALYTRMSLGIEQDVARCLQGFLSSHMAHKLEQRKVIPELNAIAQSIREDKSQQRPSYLSAPYTVNIYPTYACNQKCSFCYASCGEPNTFFRHPGRCELREVDWLRFVDKAIAAKVMCLNVLGGEPFLRFRLLLSVLERASEHMHCSFATSGSVSISKQQAARLAKLGCYVRVSIHAATPALHDKIVGLSGAFEQAIATAHTLIEAGNRCEVNMVLTRSTMNEVIPLAHLAKEIGFGGMEVAEITPGGRGYACRDKPSPSEYQLVVEKVHSEMQALAQDGFFLTYNDRYQMGNLALPAALFVGERRVLCAAGSISLEIDPYGDVYPCHLALGREEFLLGNVTVDSLEAIWNNSRLEFWRSRDARELRHPACRACPKRQDCLGGCPLSASLLRGDRYAGDPLCPWVDQFDREKTVWQTAEKLSTGQQPLLGGAVTSGKQNIQFYTIREEAS